MGGFIHLNRMQQTSELSKYSERMLSCSKTHKLFLRGNFASKIDARIPEVEVDLLDA